MDTSNGKTKEMLGRKFKTVKNGLDEVEVFDFLGGLIEQNKNLALQLEHLESLTRLAERTVIEADKEAENIKKERLEKASSQAAKIIAEGEEKAKSEANTIIAEAQRKAEGQAQDIIKSAESKAETIKTQANGEASRIIAEAKQNATVMEQRVQDIIKDAEGKAEVIKADANSKAIRIISEATEKAEELANARAESAEKEAQHIITEAREKAEHEALLIKQKSEQLLKKSKKIAESEIKEKLKKVYQGLLSNLEGIDETTIMPSIEEIEDTKLPEHEAGAAAIAEATIMSEELIGQPSLSRKEKTPIEKAAPEISTFYDGIVELIIPPPLGLDRMLQLHKHLRNIPNAKVLNLGVASDKSITIRVQLGGPTPLLDILAELPEVEKALEAQQEGTEMIGTTRKTGDKTPVKRILINTKK